MDGKDEWEPDPRSESLKRLERKQGMGFVESPVDPDIAEVLKGLKKDKFQ